LTVNQTPTDQSAVPALELLALARRGAAHEVNNLLAVLQGNSQLLQMLPAEQMRGALNEITLACERLTLLCDGWLLADPDPPPSAPRCGVADALQQVVTVLRASHVAEFAFACAPSAQQQDCGIEARTLRALVYCAFTTLLRCAARPAIAVRLVARGRRCTLHLQVACSADRVPEVRAPDTVASDATLSPRSASCGLWDVSQCLGRHGGGMGHSHARGVFHLRLDLPAAAV
jgi:hypothetical protein